MLNCAISVGFNQSSTVHCVGDGAPWIADQVSLVFGTQGSFLIDFFHLCEYLAAASTCAPEDKSGWFDQQKQRLKRNQTSDVIQALEPYIEPDSVIDSVRTKTPCGQPDRGFKIANHYPIDSAPAGSPPQARAGAPFQSFLPDRSWFWAHLSP